MLLVCLPAPALIAFLRSFDLWDASYYEVVRKELMLGGPRRAPSC